jgi:hypothetical protein
VGFWETMFGPEQQPHNQRLAGTIGRLSVCSSSLSPSAIASIALRTPISGGPPPVWESFRYNPVLHHRPDPRHWNPERS